MLSPDPYCTSNAGTAYYLPTGTPDRNLTLELRLLDNNEKIYKMKCYILWRPFIVDLKDTRLPYNKPTEFILDEARRKRIGYENKEPIAYPIYKKRIPL